MYSNTITSQHDKLIRVIKDHLPKEGVKIRGIHLEEPYINEKCSGTQNKETVREPDIDEFKECHRAKLITLAPGFNGTLGYIKNMDITSNGRNEFANFMLYHRA